MSSKIFLKIGNIKGESTDSKHKDEIEVFSWSWGVSTPATVGGGGGGSGAGRPTFSDLNFTHRYDKAAPLLWRACAVGQHFPEATLTGAKQGKGAKDYLIIKMSDVAVTFAQAADSLGGDAMDSVGLKFAKVDVEYKPQKADGSFDASVRFKYDIQTNKEF